MSSARGPEEKREKRARNKRASLRLAMWDLRFRITYERSPHRRPQLEAKLKKLQASYTSLGGTL